MQVAFLKECIVYLILLGTSLISLSTVSPDSSYTCDLLPRVFSNFIDFTIANIGRFFMFI